MNATEIILILATAVVIYVVFKLKAFKTAPGNFARLNRIKTASRIFQALIWISLVGGAYIYLAFLFGWPAPYHDRVRVVLSHQHIYTSPTEMPSTVYWLVMIRFGLAIFFMLVLSQLFRLYAKGILFSGKNVTCIRFLGYYLIIDWFINYQLQSTLRDMDLSTMPVFVGLLIIFIAWIMDEGRKMQEEQELTV